MIYGLDTAFLVAVELTEHLEHQACRGRISALIAGGGRLALAPQVLAEFIHVATDSRRFAQPVLIDDARNLAQQWWSAAEVDHLFPDAGAKAAARYTAGRDVPYSRNYAHSDAEPERL